MARTKKPKVEKVPRYLITKGTKTAHVLFEDGSEGKVSLAKHPEAAILPKVDRKALPGLRSSYVFAKTDALEVQFGQGIYTL